MADGALPARVAARLSAQRKQKRRKTTKRNDATLQTGNGEAGRRSW